MKKLLTLLLLVLVTAGGYYWFQKTDERDYTSYFKDTDSTMTVDHASFDALLQKYVNDEGLVNYKDWKANDEQTVRDYVQMLSKVDPTTLNRNEKLAYWINAYNALTIQGILEYYPLKSIKDKVSYTLGFSIWDDYFMNIQGQDYSLNNIEHQILRKMDEPRIHFAIVCASIGCPELRNSAYTGANIEEQLQEEAVGFFAGDRNFQLDKEAKIAKISSILEWFGEDFGGTDESKLLFIKPFLQNAEDQAFLEQEGLSIEYLHYDWNLNEQKG